MYKTTNRGEHTVSNDMYSFHISRLAVKIPIAFFALLILCTSGRPLHNQNNPNANTTPPRPIESKWKASGKNLGIQWYINFKNHQETAPWTEYRILKKVAEITGIYPQILVPAGNEYETLSLMMATNDLPDMITLQQNAPIIKTMIAQRKIYSYDELSERYCPDFMGEIPQEVTKWLKNEDGKLYVLNSFFLRNESFTHKSGIGYMTYNIRNDFYTALGKPDMSTPEGFYSALVQFKKQFPFINNQPSIPFLLSREPMWGITFIERSFGVKDYYESSDHRLSIRYKHPEYPHVVLFLNKLYREGLLDFQTFVQSSEQVTEKLSSRVFAIPEVYWLFNSINMNLQKQNRDSFFMAAEPLVAAKNFCFPSLNKTGWTSTVVPKNTKYSAEIIKFIRYLWSEEGNILMNYGEAAKDYYIDDHGLYTAYTYYDDYSQQKYNRKIRNPSGINAFPYFFYPYVTINNKAPSLEKNNMDIANKYAENESEYTDLNPDPTSPEGIIHAQINQLVKLSLPKIIMADSSEEALKGLRNMLESMESYNVSMLEQYWTSAYIINRSKLGIITPPKMN